LMMCPAVAMSSSIKRSFMSGSQTVHYHSTIDFWRTV
jgi:hypothetical protein